MITIQKNQNEEFRIDRADFNGYDLVNIRVWFKNKEGDICPSKKGIAIPITKFKEVLEALLEINSNLPLENKLSN